MEEQDAMSSIMGALTNLSGNKSSSPSTKRKNENARSKPIELPVEKEPLKSSVSLSSAADLMKKYEDEESKLEERRRLREERRKQREEEARREEEEAERRRNERKKRLAELRNN
jgi:colicin import membrane protein